MSPEGRWYFLLYIIVSIFIVGAALIAVWPAAVSILFDK